MKKKNLLFVAAAMVMAGCASDDMIGDNNATQSDNQVIGFNMQNSALTRAEETAAEAGKLGNMFIVWGEKNETENDHADSKDLVFKNYVVTYTANTKNTTLSNTANWEYVGVDHSDYTAHVTENIGNTAQTIKYWDNTAKNYTFTAITALKSDIKDGKVEIQKNAAQNSVYQNGYTVTVASDASTGNIYFSDRKVVEPETGSNKYKNEAVQLTFRNFQTKIRFAVYENIPGYNVKITGVKYKATSSAQTQTTPDAGDNSFYVDGNFVEKSSADASGKKTTYTVTYEDGTKTGETKNRVKVAVNADANTSSFLKAGDKIVGTEYIGKTATAATYDKENKGWNEILPNPDNTANMKLTVSYTLVSEDTNEKIEFNDMVAEVPAAYCKWKPNFAYTYIFKITEQSADLYPITFDAVVENDEVGSQETITTVDEPSITTYVVGKNASDEYTAGDVIYAYAQDANVTAMTSSNMKLYKVTTSDSDKFPITEASVKHALEQASASPAVTTEITATEITSGTDQPKYDKVVPAEDGTSRTITAMYWTAVDKTVYAVKYIKGSDEYYKIVKINGATGK